jgi:hypothetical protein
VLRHAAALGHGIEGGVAEPLDAQLVAQLPHADEHFVGREVVEAREHVTGVEEVLGVGEDLDGRVGQSYEVLETLVGGLVEVLFVK